MIPSGRAEARARPPHGRSCKPRKWGTARPRGHGRVHGHRRRSGAADPLASRERRGSTGVDGCRALGSGKAAVDWALEPGQSAGLVIAVLLIRTIGTSTAIGGGGVGGLFIPLLAMGAMIGRLFADNVEEVAIWVMVGGAAMLGAGYAAPLTGVVFVAEITGQPALIVPALIAMATTMLTIGNRSVSPAQQ